MMWHLNLLPPQWCFVLPIQRGAIGHRESKIQLKCFLTNDWKTVHEEFFLQTQAFAMSSSSRPLAQHEPLIHKHLFQSLVFGCARE